ncbi:MAG: class A beta-lactamase-related serine hydrolase [Anaerolineae bacterium]|nr:class A beta-lactamase-related serine hydrolase [Anaerolineae bacterium]
MSYSSYSGRRQGGFPWLEIVSIGLLIAALGLTFLHMIAFASQSETFAPGTCVGDICLDYMSRAEAVAVLERAYASSIVLTYQNSALLLEPTSIGFRLNSDTIMAEIERTVQKKSFAAGFWDYLWRRPNEPISVDVSSQYIPSQLRQFMQDVARRYDSPPEPAGFTLDTLTFRPGKPGHTLDIEASLPLIEAALNDPASRQVDLVVKATDAPEPDLTTLRDLIIAYFDSVGFVYAGREQLASIFVMDLQTGQEININPSIAFAGMSMIKIPILTDMFRHIDDAPNKEQAYLIAQTMICSGNYTANLMLAEIGSGDQCRGTTDVTEMLHALGLKNTFLTAPLVEVGAQECPFVTLQTDANQNPAFNTRPDQTSQSTPEDMGTLLSMIYDCATNGGGLRAIYPDQFTAQECRQILEVMNGNRIGVLIEKGVPSGTRIAHKHGWIEDTHGDVGIIFTPGGDYVLAMMFYNAEFLNYEQYWPMMETISRAAYNLFNPETPQLAAREVDPAEQCRTDDRAREVVDLDNIEPFVQVVLPAQARAPQ